jgi:single-stranded-DNA-specific exonuclease
MNYSEIITKLLIDRGYTTPESQQAFLSPDYEKHTYDPFLMSDMEIAVTRILQAIQNDEKICVYSDYDADGIPGATVMHDFFKKIGYESVMYYIPHRHSEGYGLHIDALEKIKNDGVTLLITVDLGITAVKEVDFARTLDIDVIITDHHEPLEVLPNAIAIVNPKVPRKPLTPSDVSFSQSSQVVNTLNSGSESGMTIQNSKLHLYPDTMLCGCATAFKLVQGILAVIRDEKKLEHTDLNFEKIAQKISVPPAGWEKWLLDMVGIATLSDMVPLINENRVFATYGLKVLKKTRRPGLLALFQIMRIRQQYLTEDDIVFSVTPRLNAASRMAHPEVAFRLLTTTDSNQAIEIAKELSRLNDERKLEVARAMRTVHKKMSARTELPTVLVVGDPDWSPGVLGLIASKMVEEYDRSVFVWCIENETVKGSCRARNGDHVVDLMNAVADQFIQYGGHEGAGGFAMHKEHVHFLEEKLNQVAQTMYSHHQQELVRQVIPSDLTLFPDQITRDFHTALSALAPFGFGNRPPVIVLQNVTPTVGVFGKNKEHLQISIDNGFNTLRGIQFFTKPERYALDIETSIPIDLYGHIEYSVFMGKGELRMRIIHVDTIKKTS